MATVVPTVLATTPDEYGVMLERAEGLSSRVHVDICDGKFADNATISLTQVHVGGDAQLDLHLMLEDPVAQLETALSLQPHLIIFHFESTGDLAAAIKHVKELGVKAGLAILPKTPVEVAGELIKQVDHVLVFTGNLGHNGGDFHADQLSKVTEVRTLNPGVEVSVDGGVDMAAASLIASTGVDVLYVGGAIHSAGDPLQVFKELSQAAA